MFCCFTSRCFLRGAAKCHSLVHRFNDNACVPRFEKCNGFIAPQHEGRYDKVHVGGSVPEDRVPILMRLLKRDNGVLIVPAGQQLCRFTLKNGQVRCCLPTTLSLDIDMLAERKSYAISAQVNDA